MKPELITPDTRCLSLEEAFRYTHGQSSATERSRVETHITTCDLCFESLAGARKMSNLQEARTRTEALHRSLRDSLQPQKKATRVLHWPALALSAAAAILIVFTGVFLANRHPNRDLAYENFEPFPNTVPITRGSASLLEDAMAYYELGEYEESAAKLESYMKNEPSDDRAKIYSAVCRIALKTPEKAIPVLTSFTPQNLFFQDSRWYLTLAYLATDQEEKANQIINSGVFGGTIYEGRIDRIKKRKNP